MRSPKYVIYIQVDDPKGKYYGSTVAAPVFAKVAKFAMRKSGAVPVLLSGSSLVRKPGIASVDNNNVQNEALRSVKEDLQAGELGTAPNFLGLSLRQVYRRAATNGIKIRVKGKGRVVRTWPDPGDKLGRSKHMRIRLEQSL